MKTAWKLLFGLSLAFNAAFVAAWAARPISAASGDAGKAPCGGPGSVGCPLYRQLGVTPEQWRMIEPALKDYQERCGEECLAMEMAKDSLIQLVGAPEPDMEAIRVAQREIIAAHERMQASLVDHLLAAKGALTEDQQRRLFGMMRSHVCGCHGRGRYGSGGGCRRGH